MHPHLPHFSGDDLVPGDCASVVVKRAKPRAASLLNVVVIISFFFLREFGDPLIENPAYQLGFLFGRCLESVKSPVSIGCDLLRQVSIPRIGLQDVYISSTTAAFAAV